MKPENKFIEKLQPYIDRVKVISFDEVDFTRAYEIFRNFSNKKMTFEEFNEKSKMNLTILCAQVLRVVEESWLPFETSLTLKDVISDYGNQLDKKFLLISRQLEKHNFIEVQGARIRRKQ